MANNHAPTRDVVTTAGGNGTATRFGAGVFAVGDANVQFLVDGVWVVTAP
jgi:hypothetical protein